MIIDIPIKNDYTSVWDKPTPIVEVNEKLYRVYMVEEIGAPNEFTEVVELLADLDDSVTVEFNINTPGGLLNSVVMVVDAIVNTEAKCIGKLSGIVASAGTMIALAMDELVIAKHTGFMVHSYSGGLSGKGNELKAQQAYTEKANKELFKDTYTGFLTSREITKVINGMDIWLNKEEVETRFEKMVNKSSSN